MNSAEGFALIITLWRHKKSLKLVYAKTLSAKTLKLVLAINSNLKVPEGQLVGLMLLQRLATGAAV